MRVIGPHPLGRDAFFWFATRCFDRPGGAQRVHTISSCCAAELIETTQSGREMINMLRRLEFDRRFPGLLDAVLANRPG